MIPEQNKFYTTPLKKLCLYVPKNISFDDRDGDNMIQFFEEESEEEYWIPEKQIKEAPKCRKCGDYLKVITIPKGKFWGCRHYLDGCSDYIPIEQLKPTVKQEELFRRIEEVEGTPSSFAEALTMSKGWLNGR